jgi:uncharacterized phiE125 gp8 family phage protein
MSLKLITAPAAEPVSLVEAKAHLRVDVTDDDTLITALIVAAREAAEHITGRSLMPATWELALDGFVDAIDLPRPPLLSITSVKYVDTSGDQQTVANGAWMLDSYSEPGRLMPSYGECWPATRAQANAVLIRYTAGYANAAAVPQQIKNWMLLRIGMLYENRESVVTGVTLTELPYVDRMLDAYRVWSL